MGICGKESFSSAKWRRFRQNKRAFFSLAALAAIFFFSLVLPFFLPSPERIANPADFMEYRKIKIRVIPELPVGRINVAPDMTVVSMDGDKSLLGNLSQRDSLANHYAVSKEFLRQLSLRFGNQDCGPYEENTGGTMLHLPKYKARPRPPRSVRIRIEKAEAASVRPMTLAFGRQGDGSISPVRKSVPLVEALLSDIEGGRCALFEKSFDDIALASAPVKETVTLKDGSSARLEAMAETVAWPFRPVKGHPMGIDCAGRDVLSLVVSATGTALTFSIVLVLSSMAIGILAGAVQGYFGGIADLAGQRFIEVWSSLPFLYVMILLGSVFGRSFGLLLFCYGIFNWIGVSAYTRAEFLRLRGRPFIDAARTQGLGHAAIAFRHILPNAVSPLVTILPFSLIGAISSLSALDFLGFGLPPLTPSLGELLSQARQNTSAWWLILYPSLTLFSIMLLSVFVGEGLRDAFDPKPLARYR